jgi:allantoate deiminase/N-carbamoyl-L-amino-acid hydrolase
VLDDHRAQVFARQLILARQPSNREMPLSPSTPAERATPGGFGRRILDLADRLASFSETPDGLTCTYLTPAHRAAASQLLAWTQEAGMAAGIDVVGNVVGRYPATDPQAKTLIVGSHYDTVRNAGKYDGRLGILTALVVIEQLACRGQRLPFHVELIGFAEEEGVRFGTAYMGSRVVAGTFDPQALERRDATGLSVGDLIRSTGTDPAGIATLARRPQDLLGYIEVHIEQGPVLLEAGLPLGIVSAIAGGARFAVSITGVAGHAGTVPMATRHDAAAAAAEVILYVEKRCSEAPGLVGTVGQLAVPDGAINVIPARCELSLDIRADEAAKRDRAIDDVLAEIDRIAKRRGVSIEVAEIQRMPVVPCSADLQRLLGDAIARAGFAALVLPSGAGHDAVTFHGLAPVGMLFVRCGNGGVSHSPLETVLEGDADLAARVLIDLLTTADLAAILQGTSNLMP